MKRTVILTLVMLILTACGVPAAEPSPSAAAVETQAPTPEQYSTPSDLTVQTPNRNTVGMSPYAVWATDKLGNVRQNPYMDDEERIRKTVELFIYLSCDQMYEPEYGRYEHFDAFFSKTSEGYENLMYNATETRYFGLMNTEPSMYGPIVWYDYDVDVMSVEIDGDTAKVEAKDHIQSLRENYSGMSSGTFYYYLDLCKVNGVWLMTDVFPVSRFDGYVSYEELLETIAAMEEEYALRQ